MQVGFHCWISQIFDLHKADAHCTKHVGLTWVSMGFVKFYFTDEPPLILTAFLCNCDHCSCRRNGNKWKTKQYCKWITEKVECLIDKIKSENILVCFVRVQDVFCKSTGYLLPIPYLFTYIALSSYCLVLHVGCYDVYGGWCTHFRCCAVKQ